MWHLFYTFLHNSSEGMFLCLPEELYILSAFFVSHVHSVFILFLILCFASHLHFNSWPPFHPLSTFTHHSHCHCHTLFFPFHFHPSWSHATISIPFPLHMVLLFGSHLYSEHLMITLPCCLLVLPSPWVLPLSCTIPFLCFWLVYSFMMSLMIWCVETKSVHLRILSSQDILFLSHFN